MKFIYLASPYSSKDPAIQKYRGFLIDQILAELYMQTGYAIFPPILVSRKIKELAGDNIGTSFSAWKDVDLCVIKHCDEVWVAMMDGWQESIGVTAEIAYAIKHRITVRYFNPNTYKFEKR